jgi:hypothetical protein
VSPLHEALAVSKPLFDQLDGWSGLRNGLRRLADDRGDWAGIPMLLDDMPLTIEPNFPNADALSAFGRKPDGETLEDAGMKVRNTFWSWHRRAPVTVWEENGKIQWGPTGHPNGALMILETLKAADAWGIEQESKAVHSLGSMLRHRSFKQYLLTGMFLETSKRSGVHYLFRRLRPTLALSSRGANMKILCALCLHPIGYYDGSWAGAMTPTDDVIAHLSLMRGDEHMFWRRSNQHPSWRHEAGL